MMKEPTNESFFYSQIGALEAEVERVKKENYHLQDENNKLRAILTARDKVTSYLSNPKRYTKGEDNGKG